MGYRRISIATLHDVFLSVCHDNDERDGGEFQQCLDHRNNNDFISMWQYMLKPMFFHYKCIQKEAQLPNYVGSVEMPNITLWWSDSPVKPHNLLNQIIINDLSLLLNIFQQTKSLIQVAINKELQIPFTRKLKLERILNIYCASPFLWFWVEICAEPEYLREYFPETWNSCNH